MKFRRTFLVLACLPASLGWGLSESELNGSRGSANGPFTFPQTITGNLQNDGEGLQDYFSFSAAAGASYSFVATVVNPAGFAPLDIDLAIENASGATVGLATSSSTSGETLNWTATSAGTYYFVVYEGTATPNNVSSYSVSAQQTSSVSDWELY